MPHVPPLLVMVSAVALLLSAGCTGTAPHATPTATPMTTVSNPLLPMDGRVVLGSGDTRFEASIDSFEMDPPTEAGKQTITIYVAVKNTGSGPVQLVWFSRLTDPSGLIFGGIGVSHGGNGARSGVIVPNMTEAARDYVVVPADEMGALSKGAVLDVYFMEKRGDSVSLVPDYHARWAIDPGTIR